MNQSDWTHFNSFVFGGISPVLTFFSFIDNTILATSRPAVVPKPVVNKLKEATLLFNVVAVDLPKWNEP
jgi:hypothetical protein